MKTQKVDYPQTLSDYNNSLTIAGKILTGKEFRRLKRKNKK
jgi:hypothetical protein